MNNKDQKSYYTVVLRLPHDQIPAAIDLKSRRSIRNTKTRAKR